MVLPNYNGWTVDFRLREFRFADQDREIIFLPFDTDNGMDLLIQIAKEHLTSDL